MNKSLQINATIDHPGLLEDMVEKLAYRRYDLGYGKQKMPPDRRALETSSAETYVSGIVAMDDSAEHIAMPFTTRFVFTCIRGNDRYKLEWGSSLS
jgi:hypothetical protein